MSKIKLFRITTIPVSLNTLLKGQLKYMNLFYDVHAISSGGKNFEEMLTEQEVEGTAINMSRRITPIKDLIALWHLCRLIRNKKPQIVHTHTPKAGTLGMLAAWLCRVPVRMHTVAGLPLLEANGLKRKLLDLVEKITYFCATEVLPNSFGLKDIILQNNYCSDTKIKVIGNGSSNGIDTQFFSMQNIPFDSVKKLKSDFEIKENDFVYIFIGRLVKDKGINELIIAFKNIYLKKANIKLLLVGNMESDLDPLLPETIQIIKEHQAIISTGFQKDVRPFLAIANALVFPSYREGFPNVPMQAGAMGIPSIVTDINGCNEIIKSNHNGLIIPAKNPEFLEKAMLQLIEDAGLFKKLASNARDSIVSRFEQQTVWNQIKEEYDFQLGKAGLI